MDLAAYRKALGLTQEECARALGITSKGYISGIESGDRRASLKLALRIERWSRGKVRADSLNPEAAGFGKSRAA
jgi:transcriptional regulator with XRE-family HTH domain